MSRSLDIAKILRATELDNTENNRLLYEGDDAARGVDSATVQSTGMQYYSTLDSLPTTNLEVGLLSFVEENRRLYVSDGNGWYNTAYVASALPYWVTEPDSTYEITDSATPLTITALANDSDNPLLVNQSFGSDSQEFMATVSNDSSVFTFTPKSADSISQSVIAGDLTDSNGDFVYTFKWSDGVNFVAKEVTITYNITSSGGGWFGERGLWAAGSFSSTIYNTIEYVSLSTTGNSTDFGDLSSTRRYGGSSSNGTRAVFAGGRTSGSDYYDTIDYVTTSTTGDASDFGNMLAANAEHGEGVGSDGTYGIFSGGVTTVIEDTIQRITIATTGDATDFGNITSTRYRHAQAGDATYTLMAGGQGRINNIDYVTNATPANSVDFGNLAVGRSNVCGTGDTTRGIFIAGDTTATVYADQPIIDYVTFATPGNATSFGELNSVNDAALHLSATSNGTRGVYGGGLWQQGVNGGQEERLEYVTIQTTGNGTDFGDLTTPRTYTSAASGSA